VVGKARNLLRPVLQDLKPTSDGAGQVLPLVLVACSGGPDSLALAAVTAYFARTGRIRAGAVVVDHQLQEASAQVAESTAELLAGLGLAPVEVVRVSVRAEGSGPEAAAREARYAALAEVRDRLHASAVLLGHTLDDQAESVLLGLARGSGTRSLAGMPSRRDGYHRPFLGLRREETLAICAAEGLQPWHDPTNTDPAFLRSRVRSRVLPFLEDELGPGIAGSLARSAAILGQDADYLDQLADAEYARLAETPTLAHNPAAGPRQTPETPTAEEVWLPLDELRDLPAALRQRVIARAVVALGGNQPSFERLQGAEVLLQRGGSAGPVQLAGKVSAYRIARSRTVPRDPSSYGKLVFRRTAGELPAPRADLQHRE
jgi:tRNA(Ile)-lysidine synthase